MYLCCSSSPLFSLLEENYCALRGLTVYRTCNGSKTCAYSYIWFNIIHRSMFRPEVLESLSETETAVETDGYSRMEMIGKTIGSKFFIEDRRICVGHALRQYRYYW